MFDWLRGLYYIPRLFEARPMKILSVHPNSIAEEIGLLADDKIISVNGNAVEDKLDFQFYTADEELDMRVERDGEEISFQFERDFDDEIGVTVEPLRYRTCGNNCVFCFVYQNPDGLRPSLYIKDEDFRLSFLYGNYTTLTNARKKDLDKIVNQRLSPQYVSIHATDFDVRKILLGTRKDDKLLEKLKYLTDNRIEIHGQIVLCPEINDGDILHKTIADLLRFRPYFSSVAIVPIGLTKHREGLMELKTVNDNYARNFIAEVDSIRQRILKTSDEPFVYLSDEWYLKAGYEVPDADYYNEFFQVENGVGICREFILSIEEQAKIFPTRFNEKKRVTLVTAESAGIILKKHLLPRLAEIDGLDVNTRILKNNFFGEGITVSGLLTGTDIYNQLKGDDVGDLVVLPPRCLNPDGFFLDNTTPAELEEKLNTRVIIYPYDMNEVFAELSREPQKQVVG